MLEKKYFQLKRARTCKNVQERAKPKMNVVSLHCLKIRAQYQNDMAEETGSTPHTSDTQKKQKRDVFAEDRNFPTGLAPAGARLKRKETFAEDKNML